MVELIGVDSKDLRVPGTFSGIPILPAAQALEHINTATGSIP